MAVVASIEEPLPGCPKCGRQLVLRTGRWGTFFGCSGYPECAHLVSAKKALTDEPALPSMRLTLEMETVSTFRAHGPPGLRYALEALQDFGLNALHWDQREDWGDNESSARCTAVFALADYDPVVQALWHILGMRKAVVDIPLSTLAWFRSPAPRMATVDRGVLRRLPEGVQRALFPFQAEGILFGLSCGARVLFGDEMGLGKSIQALSLACLLGAFPLLVVCPSCMRLVWAEEWEKWVPTLPPSDLHVIFDSNDKLPQTVLPKVTVVSYRMAAILLADLAPRPFQMIIVDESHALRTTLHAAEAQQTSAVRELLRKAPHAALLSGTPSVTRPFDMFTQVDALRPGLLGSDKWTFAHAYCEVTHAPYLTVGRCVREWELNLLLTDALLIRRTKHQVMDQLPAKMRHLVPLPLAPLHHPAATSTDPTDAIGNDFGDDGQDIAPTAASSPVGPTGGGAHRQRQYHEAGVLKAPVAAKWLHAALANSPEGTKFVVFAHHLAVLTVLQRALEKDGRRYVRIDGSTPAVSRAHGIRAFTEDPGLPVALVGVTASALGIDLSIASVAVFVELPPDVGWLLQAEDRLHRRGQCAPVLVYILMGHCVDSGPGAPSPALLRCQRFDADTWAAMGRGLQSIRRVTEGPLSMTHGAALPAAEGPTDVAETLSQQSPQKPSSSRRAVTPPSAPEGCRPEHVLFEVSTLTRRIHLYQEGAPITPLGINVRPEDAAPVGQAGALPDPLWEAAAAFLEEYRRLTPYQQRRLRGVPMRRPSLPAPTLATASPPTSPRPARYSARTDPEAPLPAGGRWAPVAVHYGSPLHRTVTYFLPTDAAGCPLCMTCGVALDMLLRPQLIGALEAAGGPLAGAVPEGTIPPPEARCSENDLFCSGPCRLQYFLRRNGALLRRQLFQLERGVCRHCGLDASELCARLQATDPSAREALVLRLAPHFGMEPAALQALVDAPTEGNAWNADHVVPVHLNGGCCGLENLQTLCVACHRRKTRDEAAARASSSLVRRRTVLPSSLPPDPKRPRPPSPTLPTVTPLRPSVPTADVV